MTIEQTIHDFLKLHKSVKRFILLQYLHNQGFEINDRCLRRLKEVMNVSGKYNIGSSDSKGYFIIDSKELLDESLKQYRAQAQSNFRNANIIYKNFYGKELNQLEMFK